MKDIINFLEELAANNDRAWFEANRDRYKAVKSRMDVVAKDFIEAVAAFDPSVEGVQVKDTSPIPSISPIISLNKVDFPHPFGPTMPIFCLSKALKEALCKSSCVPI